MIDAHNNYYPDPLPAITKCMPFLSNGMCLNFFCSKLNTNKNVFRVILRNLFITIRFKRFRLKCDVCVCVLLNIAGVQC